MGVDTEDVLDADGAAELLRVHKTVIYKLLQQRHETGFPGRKVGREWRIERTALRNWLGSVEHRNLDDDEETDKETKEP